jgi:hypothetical protein
VKCQLRLKKYLIVDNTINQRNQMAALWEMKLPLGWCENEKTGDERGRRIPRILPTLTVAG